MRGEKNMKWKIGLLVLVSVMTWVVIHYDIDVMPDWLYDLMTVTSHE